MAKLQTRFVCQACGAAVTRWMGRCGSCGAWNTLVEEAEPKKLARAAPSATSRVQAIGDVAEDSSARVPTGIGELDRVLGGGAVLGGVVLVGGDPGVGKSTLLMQALAGLARKGCPALYVSGEESAGQTAARARRLSGVAATKDLMVLAENDLDAIERAIAECRPRAVVVDSVQTVRAGSLESAAGTVSQLREVAARFVERAKKDGIATFLVGHVTKDGAIAGPKVLEHIVDTVLSFEGERGHALRTLRAQKNRFGSATEVGVFEMTAEGMREVDSPSKLFLAERPKGASGSVIAATSEGARSLLVEVQALVGPSAGGSGRRTCTGVDSARLAMILAVLDRKCGLSVTACDVFVNVAGGARIDEPAMDLAVALAVASSYRDRPVSPEIVAFGEIGLAGEVRGCSRVAGRLAEASALGFKRAIAPVSAGGTSADIEVLGVRTLAQAIELAM